MHPTIAIGLLSLILVATFVFYRWWDFNSRRPPHSINFNGSTKRLYYNDLLVSTEVATVLACDTANREVWIRVVDALEPQRPTAKRELMLATVNMIRMFPPPLGGPVVEIQVKSIGDPERIDRLVIHEWAHHAFWAAHTGRGGGVPGDGAKPMAAVMEETMVKAVFGT